MRVGDAMEADYVCLPRDVNKVPEPLLSFIYTTVAIQ